MELNEWKKEMGYIQLIVNELTEQETAASDEILLGVRTALLKLLFNRLVYLNRLLSKEAQ